MKPYYIIEESIQALRSNVLRSSLTIVGIVVGIFSVTAMLALGTGLSGNIMDRFDSFVAGDITISGDLTRADMTWLQEQPYVNAVLAQQSINGTTVIAGDTDFLPTISIAVGQYEEVKSLNLISGEAFDFTDLTYDERVVLVNEGFVSTVAEDTGVDVTNGEVVINGQKFKVIGVTEGGTEGFGRRGDGTLIMPYADALGVVTDSKLFASASVDLVEQEYYEIAAEDILASLNLSRYAARDSSDYFSVSSAQEMIESALETTQMITMFLGIVGGIALFVGGIGTMNMMLTTVTERTKEIGLRKAIGARDRDIMFQILAESVTLTFIGGAIGIALTYGMSSVANQLLADNNMISVVLSGQVVIYATFVSFAVGVVFGLYPARSASKLQPADALRVD